MKLLVTGASGFIGRALCKRLSESGGFELSGTVRSAGSSAPTGVTVKTRELAPDTNWHDALDSVEVVVHTAARVHVAAGPDGYRRVNVDGTVNLARQASACGVRRFVFLSSVKVNGEATPPGKPFRADDAPAPADPYGRSKHEAEIELKRIGEAGNMEVVTIRPALVYGPGVKANVLNLMRWVYKGYPLPLAGVGNARSLVAVQNLVDLIRICCAHPSAANETFMAADEEDVSTAELITGLGIALDRPARLFPVPANVLLMLSALMGKREQANKLLGNLQVDARRTRERLGWQALIDREQALQSMARHFLEGLR